MQKRTRYLAKEKWVSAISWWKNLSHLVPKKGENLGPAQPEEVGADLLLLARHCKDAVVLFDREGRVLAWNQGAEALYGWPEREALNEVLPVLPPSLRQSALRKLKSLDDKRPFADGNTVHITAHGEKLEVNVTWAEVPWGPERVGVLLMVARNVSLAMRLGTELEILQGQLSSLATLAHLLADFSDLRHTMQLALAALMRAVGASFCLLECYVLGSEDAYQTVRVGTEPEGPIMMTIQKAAQIARETRSVARLDAVMAVSLRTLDREFGVLAMLQEPDFNVANRAQIVEMVAQQLASVLYIAALLYRERQAGDKMREVEKLRGDFVAMVSHELRTPLTCIKGFADTLLRKDAVWQAIEQHDFLQSIKISSEQALRIVDDILSIQQVEQGKVNIVLAPIDLAHLVSEACRRAQSISDQHTILRTVPDSLPVIRADFVRISQVMDNLLENAIKYSPLGGEIWVRVRGMLGEIEISVTDYGIGIPAEQQEKIFEQFYRVDNSVMRKTEGIGLGLAIVRNIVLLHGGRIWVTSTAGAGSTFYFTLLS